MDLNLSKVAIVTGAGGGIGSAVSVALARAGYRVVLTDVDEAGLNQTAARVSAEGAAFFLYPGDLESGTFLESIVEATVEKWGRIDLLVNNAAWRTISSLRSMDMDTWDKTLRICLTAPVFLTKQVAEVMESQGISGVIINVTSVMAERPAGTSPAYIAAKGALESLTKELAVTYGRRGIRVVAVAPGYIETDLSNDYEDESGENISERLIGNLTDSIPLGRGGLSVEVARAMVWLASDEAAYITGTTLLIDGGFKHNFSAYSQKQLQFPKEF